MNNEFLKAQLGNLILLIIGLFCLFFKSIELNYSLLIIITFIGATGINYVLYLEKEGIL